MYPWNPFASRTVSGTALGFRSLILGLPRGTVCRFRVHGSIEVGVWGFQD